MLQRSFKYLTIATINLIILTVLLLLWTDELLITLNGFVLILEFFSILKFTMFSLIGMRVLVFYFRKKKIYELKTKLRLAIFITLLISSYLYVEYSVKIVNNLIKNRQFRTEIMSKIKPSGMLVNGTKGENLTIKEYREIAKISGFPELPIEATNIKYNYSHDELLPDYFFSLVYDLPKYMKVDTVHYEKGDFNKYRVFEIVGNKKRVTYEEGEK
jgi:hypothetical protein